MNRKLKENDELVLEDLSGVYGISSLIKYLNDLQIEREDYLKENNL